MKATGRLAPAVMVGVLLSGAAIAAEPFRRGGTELNAVRTVSIPAGKSTPIVVTEFFHHGEISADGKNVVVCGRKDELLPMKVLQLGPGDFCRLAFQPQGQDHCEIFYGGDPPKEKLPQWTSREGLLLETRQYKDCNLNNLDSVRDAFKSAKPIGADYVENVHHSSNPFSSGSEPFLSRYSGYLHIASAATYGFLTGSQDCSFVLVDDKLVIAAPGRHGPAHDAQRGSRGDVKLAAGEHKFEYYHAVAGPNAIMAAAWEVNPPDVKPAQVVAIPADVLHSKSITRALAGPVAMRNTKAVPDFFMKIAGDVPLPDNNTPLVGVSFKDASPKAVSLGAKIVWDFGDGQTSDKLNPDHVYLRPGLYAVKLSFRRAAAKPVEIVNRIYVDRPQIIGKEKDVKDKLHALDEYLPMLQTYDPRTLDAAGLRQLLLAYEAKAIEIQAKADAEKAKSEEPETKPAAKKPASKKPAEDKVAAEVNQWISRAVEAGKVAFVEESAARGDEDLMKLAQFIAPMARDRLGNSELTFQIWKGAAQRINVGELKAECEAEAADVAVNDLLGAKEAKALLDAANTHLGNRTTGAAASKVQRAWGDYYAMTGDGKAARKAYHEAERILGSSRKFIESTAWRGAHSRSAEEFIEQGQLDRAAAEIRAWQREFPSEKLDGYLTLLYLKYWAAREKYAQAVAQAEQLAAASPDSAYIDQVLVKAAECEVRRGKVDRALATLHSLAKDYPGSPLLPDVKKTIARLEAGDTGTKRPPRKPPPGGEEK